MGKWNIPNIEKYDEYGHFIKKHYKIVLDELENRTNGLLKGDTIYRPNFREFDNSLSINMGIKYLEDYPSYEFLNTIIQYDGKKTSLKILYVNVKGKEILIDIEDEKDFEEKFYNIIGSEEAGQRVFNLINIATKFKK